MDPKYPFEIAEEGRERLWREMTGGPPPKPPSARLGNAVLWARHLPADIAWWCKRRWRKWRRGLRRPWRWLRNLDRIGHLEAQLFEARRRAKEAERRVGAWEEFLESADRQLQEGVWKAQGASEPPKEG
jgi:hypothetical protein